jgi:hypothetical protein
MSLYCSLLFLSAFSSLRAIEYFHPEAEAEQFVTALENHTITWQVDDAYGVFGDFNYHPNTMFRYYVEEVDLVHSRYEVNESSYSWTVLTWGNWSDAKLPDFYLTKRDWGGVAVNVLLNNDSQYWGNKALIDETYSAVFADEWVNGALTSTVTISYRMNVTNYDIAKYTRAEGILLSREFSVNIINGSGPNEDLVGYFKVSYYSSTIGLTISFWHWIVWFLIILAILFVVLIILSAIISRRKQVYREIAEI